MGRKFRLGPCKIEVEIPAAIPEGTTREKEEGRGEPCQKHHQREDGDENESSARGGVC